MTDDEGDLALLPELLDHSFGAGPDGLPTPADRLAAGRRARRRRQRLGLVATSVGVLAAVGVGVAISGASGDRAEDRLPPLATSGTSPSPGSSAEPSPSAAADLTEQQLAQELERLAQRARERAHRIEQQQVSNQFPASLDPRGGPPIVKDGWRILQRVEEPMGFQPPEASLGVVVTDGEETRWMLLTLENQVDEDGRPTGVQGPSAAADDPGKGFARFEDWLADMVELNGGARTPALVVVADDDSLRAGPGAELVESRAAPVIEGYTTDGDRMAEVRQDGRTWFVVVRGHGRDAEVIPVDAAVLPEPSFAAFVAHVRSQAASGEGLR